MALDMLLIASEGRLLAMDKNLSQTVKKTFSIVIFGCSLAGIFGSLGCNTVHGLGQDIERGGEKTQDAADSVKRRL